MESEPKSSVVATSTEQNVHAEHHQEIPKQKIQWRVVVSFFLLGLLIALPSSVITTGSNKMFTGITGVYEVCASLTGAIASVGTPFIARHLPYNTSTAICTLSTALAYLISTLPHPLEGDGTPKSKAAPVIGTMFGGFVYAFGTNIYMAAAAFFPPEAVLALSIGSGFGIIAGPALYTGIMAAFDNDWRRTFLVLLCTPPLMELTWRLTDPGCRTAAEKSRVDSLVKDRMLDQSREPRDQGGLTPSQQEAAGSDSYDSPAPAYFGPHRSRVGFVIKVIFPRYVLPLIFCTSSAIVTLLGTTPTLQTVESFKDAPGGDLQFQYSFISYGVAQFLFSILSSLRPFPYVWFWSALQISVMTIGLLQFVQPFLKHYMVWVVMLFLTGACVGGGVTNTNYALSEDFRKAGVPDSVRSFAMSFAGVGNFGGDATGGALGVMVQQIATKALQKRT